MKGHRDSIFGIGSNNGRYIATGDYKGNMIVWELNGSEYDLVQRLSVVGTIQDICGHNEQCFTDINESLDLTPLHMFHFFIEEATFT